MFRFNWQYRIIAVVLALFFWYLVSGQEKVEVWLNVPVEVVNLPPEHMIRSGLVSNLRVRVRGTSTILKRLEINRLSYILDLSEVRKGNNVMELKSENLDMPRALEVEEIVPASLELEVDRRASKTVKVDVDWQAHISPDYELKEIRVEPREIQIAGSSRIIEAIEEVQTEKIIIDQKQPRRILKKVNLDLFSEIEASADQVLVQLSFGPVLQEIWVRKPVEVQGDKDLKYKLDPEYARANLRLPAFLLRTSDWRDKITYYIRVGQWLEPGTHEVELMFELPRDVEVAEARPEKIRVEIQKPDSKD